MASQRIELCIEGGKLVVRLWMDFDNGVSEFVTEAEIACDRIVRSGGAVMYSKSD